MDKTGSVQPVFTKLPKNSLVYTKQYAFYQNQDRS